MTRKNTDRKVRELDTDFSQMSTEGAKRNLLAAIKLMEQDYRVSLPVVDKRYDLIAEKYPKYVRVQVKNLKLEYQKTLDQPLSIDQWVIRAFTNPKGIKRTYDNNDIDVVFAISLETNDFAIVPVDRIPSSGIVKMSEKCSRKEFFNSFKALDEI